jgi:hypothetical protein
VEVYRPILNVVSKEVNKYVSSEESMNKSHVEQMGLWFCIACSLIMILKMITNRNFLLANTDNRLNGVYVFFFTFSHFRQCSKWKFRSVGIILKSETWIYH